MTQRNACTAVAFAAIGICAFLTSSQNFGRSLRLQSADDPLPSAEKLLEALPGLLTAEIPCDVDRNLLAKLKAAKQLPREHLLFNILSWREFVAVCWPVDDNGKPRSSINDAGSKRFAGWKTDYDTFQPDGLSPAPWGKNHLNRRFASKGIHAGVIALDKISAVHGTLQPKLPSGISDVKQAFAFPIWDQNGWMVRYEIYLNKDEFDYIVAKNLYSLDGQAAFSKADNKISFPVDVSADKPGAIELKLAWKVLDESKGDLPGRFLVVKGTIFTGPDSKPVEKTLGLVGMHIAHRTQSSPQWIWSTFMHVDSLQTNSLETFEGKPIKPLFVSTDNATALVNVPAQIKEPFLDGKAPTQILALTPVPLATEQVNRVARRTLRTKKSVLQYYVLLDTQWPMDPTAAPSPPDMAPDSITNKPGGRPTPIYLINPLMETYFQLGNQSAVNQEEGGNDKTQVFGTESCMGCHSSAPIATNIKVAQGKKSADFGPQLSGGFSWLLQRRAHYTK